MPRSQAEAHRPFSWHGAGRDFHARPRCYRSGSRSDPGSDGGWCSGNGDAGPVVGPGAVACFKNAPLKRSLRPCDPDSDPDVQRGRIVVRVGALADRNVREVFGEIAAGHRRGQDASGGRYRTGCLDMGLGSNRPWRPLQNRQRRQNDWEEAEERAFDHRCRSPKAAACGCPLLPRPPLGHNPARDHITACR